MLVLVDEAEDDYDDNKDKDETIREFLNPESSGGNISASSLTISEKNEINFPFVDPDKIIVSDIGSPAKKAFSFG